MAESKIPKSVHDYAQALGRGSQGVKTIYGFGLDPTTIQLMLVVTPGTPLEDMVDCRPVTNKIQDITCSVIHVRDGSEEIKRKPRDSEILYKEQQQ